jgi:CRP/FNR family transcriptional regulator, cyclic AMP receptor protein
MKNTDYLKHFAFFSDLPEEDLESISNITLERNYKKNMLIFMEGEPGEAFYYIKSGKVKIFRTYEDGKEHIINICSEGDVFGEATLFSNIPYPASASVYEDSTIGIIKNSQLEALIQNNTELALKIIKVLAKKLIFAQHKIKDLAFNDVFARTASQILKLAKEYGSKTDKGLTINIELSRQELADMVGTTRETVSRAIGKFKKEKSITEDNDKLVILNIEKLKSWI